MCAAPLPVFWQGHVSAPAEADLLQRLWPSLRPDFCLSEALHPRLQVLTLANGDRILMTPAMKAMFEPENLANASPATISRAGIIYISDTELGWGPIVTSWLAERPPAVAAALKPCFDKFVQPVLDLIRCVLLVIQSAQLSSAMHCMAAESSVQDTVAAALEPLGQKISEQATCVLPDLAQS